MENSGLAIMILVIAFFLIILIPKGAPNSIIGKWHALNEQNESCLMEITKTTIKITGEKGQRIKEIPLAKKGFGFSNQLSYIMFTEIVFMYPDSSNKNQTIIGKRRKGMINISFNQKSRRRSMSSMSSEVTYARRNVLYTMERIV